MKSWVLAAVLVGCASAPPSPPPPAPPPPALVCPPPPAPPPPKRLGPEDWGIRAFTPPASPNPPPEWLTVSPLTSDSERPWLTSIAKKNKVVLLGETHWYGDIARLAQQMFLTLNEVDAFDLLTLELPYSSSAYFDHYVGMCDDAEAEGFFASSASVHVDTEELLALLKAVRTFNCTHPKRRLHIGAHDLEWASERTLKTVLAPYFESFDASLKVPHVAKRDTLDRTLKDMRGWLVRAKAKNHIGAYPFETPAFIDNVLTNLETTSYVWQHEDEMSFYRQKGIVRNLTNRAFQGHYFDGKVMVYGGGEHMAAHKQLADGGGFLVEGSYLEFDHAPTRGKVYSVLAEAYAYRFESMAGKDAPSETGSGYGDLMERFNEAFEHGATTATAPYLMWGPLRDFEPVLAEQSARVHGPVLATSQHAEWQKKYGAYDAVIAFAESPVQVARYPKPRAKK